jgi:hypothetical protein
LENLAPEPLHSGTHGFHSLLPFFKAVGLFLVGEHLLDFGLSLGYLGIKFLHLKTPQVFSDVHVALLQGSEQLTFY